MTLLAVKNGWINKSIIENNFMVLSNAQVDGETWYTITTFKAVCAEWVRTQEKTLWVAQKVSHFTIFDIHEKLYTIMLLRWQ